ncbi:uncharacterized protein [Lolium perenne]|uniref:uncharacterized protein isoform X1 n=1 Tax=Lolium perenne TaxID=4522 RepID=UPI003A9915F8
MPAPGTGRRHGKTMLSPCRRAAAAAASSVTAMVAQKNGGADLKHPDSANSYASSHLNVYLPDCHIEHIEWSDSDGNVVAEEARLRHIYKVQPRWGFSSGYGYTKISSWA